ncbi:MAG TPA: 2-amino-4-hydroxy-6-hydroxymethyldihydropteridine diphosphokinase [Pseudogracilibacillus sp.]|nr:2-amino-4-hydroxy-6-hydroxymethyldihydropteridine diphosphokinase [Pseudogracilibacillus sp.]
MNIAYIGLGSNIEPRHEHLKAALELLCDHEEIKLTKQSSIYETEPVDYLDQAQFLNMVVEVETTLTNLELLASCQKIEAKLGRDRAAQEVDKGPRTMDLDILLFNNENRDLDILRIPHPRMHERAFVLIPLQEIVPDKVMPTSGKEIDELIDRLSEKDLAGVTKWGT